MSIRDRLWDSLRQATHAEGYSEVRTLSADRWSQGMLVGVVPASAIVWFYLQMLRIDPWRLNAA